MKIKRRTYLIGPIVYLIVRLLFLITAHQLSLSYFIDNELSSFLGFTVGYLLLIYTTNIR